MAHGGQGPRKGFILWVSKSQNREALDFGSTETLVQKEILESEGKIILIKLCSFQTQHKNYLFFSRLSQTTIIDLQASYAERPHMGNIHFQK